MNEREFWLTILQALLLLVDAIEQRLQISPRMAEIKRLLKKLESGL